MLKKNYSKTGRSCRVTFKLPPELRDAEAEATETEANHAGATHTGAAEDTTAESISVLGDWNGWNADEHLLTPRKDGSFSTTLSLEAGKRYRFRYLTSQQHWLNDDHADELVPNRFGGHDCVIAV